MENRLHNAHDPHSVSNVMAMTLLTNEALGQAFREAQIDGISIVNVERVVKLAQDRFSTTTTNTEASATRDALTDDYIDRVLRTRIPGGSEVWWSVNGGGMQIDDGHRITARRIIEAARTLDAMHSGNMGGIRVPTWRAPLDTPALVAGDNCYAIIAVRRKHNDMIYSFPAQYLNRKPLLSENPRDASGNGWAQMLADELADSDIHVTGWFSETSTPDGEYDVHFKPVLAEGDELVAWAEIPQFAMFLHQRGESILPVGEGDGETGLWGWLVDGVPFRGKGCADKTAIPLYIRPAPADGGAREVIAGCDAERREDMGTGRLRLTAQDDGDMCVFVIDDDGSSAGVEFCNSGGKSDHTLQALRDLSRAMRKDSTLTVRPDAES